MVAVGGAGRAGRVSVCFGFFPVNVLSIDHSCSPISADVAPVWGGGSDTTLGCRSWTQGSGHGYELHRNLRFLTRCLIFGTLVLYLESVCTLIILINYMFVCRAVKYEMCVHTHTTTS